MSETAAEARRSWWRRTVIRAPFATPRDLRGQQIIVTGASPGSIGFATAGTLAAWGASVMITARHAPQEAADSLNRGLPEGGGQVRAAALDLSQAESVAAFVAQYIERQGARLDVLINNAGIHLDLLSQWKQPHLTADGHELHWRINYLGTFDLTQMLLPMLLDSAARHGAARVVTVVSQLHDKGNNAGLLTVPETYDSWVAYGLSKLGLVHMSFELQRRYAARGLSSCCLHPGAVYSQIADRGLEGAPRLARLRKALAPLEQAFMLNTQEGAQTTLHCATAPCARAGGYFRRCQPAAASPAAADTAVAAQLWEQTLAWTRTARCGARSGGPSVRSQGLRRGDAVAVP